MRRVIGGGDWWRVEVYVFVYVVEGATADSEIGVVVTMWSPQVDFLRRRRECSGPLLSPGVWEVRGAEGVHISHLRESS